MIDSYKESFKKNRKYFSSPEKNHYWDFPFDPGTFYCKYEVGKISV